jgi:CheY-like chemotaxis protein
MEQAIKVLLVDDDEHDPLLFDVLAESTRFNLRLSTARDGQQAIDYLEGRGEYADRRLYPLPDLVVLDLKMPYADGFHFLEWRKNSAGFGSLPVVVFSGSARKEDTENALGLGANRFFIKPDNMEDWKGVIHEILDFGMKHRLIC